MNLFIHTAAADKTQAAVQSLTDTTPVAELEQLVLGDSAPLTIKFTDGSAAPAWAGDASYGLSVGIGQPDSEGILAYSSTSAFTPITAGWSGRLSLDTQDLITALSLLVNQGPMVLRPPTQRYAFQNPRFAWFVLQVFVTDPAGNRVTYAALRVSVLNRVLPAVVTENDSFGQAVQQTLVDGADIAWNVALGPWAVVTITDNRNFLNPTNRIAGQILILEVRQAGGLVPTFGDQFFWPLPDSTPPASTGLRQVYSFACTDDGKLLGSMVDFVG